MSAEITSIKICERVKELSSTSEADCHIGNYVIEEEANSWKILDSERNVVFNGSLRDCQEWLDRSENHLPESGFWALLKSLLLDSR